MVGGLGGAECSHVDGVQGRAKSPLRVIERRHVLLALDGLNALEEPRTGGCNGGAQRAPLPRCRVLPDYTLRVLKMLAPSTGLSILISPTAPRAEPKLHFFLNRTISAYPLTLFHLDAATALDAPHSRPSLKRFARSP